MKSLILMMQFLTKLPLPIELKTDEDDFTKGIIWFPFVGMIIGLLSYGVYLLTQVFDVQLVRFVLVVAFQIFITGGLHLDGLADTFDGLYSYRDKERMLEIMKDSRVGTNGVLVLIMSILLKVVLLMSIDADNVFIVLILMPTYSRLMGVFLAKISKYARPNGMGGFFIGKTSNLQLGFAILSAGIISLIAWQNLIIIPMMMLCSYLYKMHVHSKIDGITGDVLGSWIEMSEILFLMIFIIL